METEYTEWEYLVTILGSSRDMQQNNLDDLGVEGWELVAIVEDMFYFKRRKRAKPEMPRVFIDAQAKYTGQQVAEMFAAVFEQHD